MTSILIRAAALAALIVLGYSLKKSRVLKREDFAVLTQLVMKITLPCAVITNFSNLKVETSFLLLVVLGVASNVIMLGLGYLLSLRRTREEKAFSMINSAGYNIGSFSMPYLQSFLNESGILAVCLFDAGNSLMCTGMTYSIAAAVAGKERSTVRTFLKNTLSSVPLLCYVAMTILSLLHLQLPEFFLATAKVAGDANPFLAMLLLGLSFELKLSKEQAGRIVKILLVRYGTAILLALAAYRWLPFPIQLRQGMVLVLFAPLSSVCTIFTHRIRGNTELSGTLNSISIVCSILIMTGLMLWMQAVSG